MTVKTILDLNKTDYSLEKEFSNIETMYGSADLSTCSLFAGGYINFGYWKNINLLKKISESERILSEKNLYNFQLTEQLFKTCVWGEPNSGGTSS